MGKRAKSVPIETEDSRKCKKEKPKKEKKARPEPVKLKKERDSSVETSESSSGGLQMPRENRDKISQLEDVALAFGLSLGWGFLAFISRVPRVVFSFSALFISECSTHLCDSASFRCILIQDVRKPKRLQVRTRTQLHLKDLDAAQLATCTARVVPLLTPLKLMKLRGEALQAM